MIKDKLISDREEYIKARDTLERDYKYIIKAELPPVYYMYQGIINYIDYLLEKIDKEDEVKDIPLIPDDELIILKQEKAIDMQKAIDFNFKVLKEKINQVIKVINDES